MAISTPTLRRKGFMQRWKGPSRKRRVGAGVDPARYMFFASRTQSPSGYPVDTTPIGATYFASKLKFGNAPYAVRNPRMNFIPFSMQEGLGPQETNLPGNDVVVDGATLVVDGVEGSYEADFAGSPSVTLVSGTRGAWATYPTLTADIPADADFTVLLRWHVASVGQKFAAGYRVQKHRGEKYWCAADASALDALITADAPTSAALDINYAVAPGNQSTSQIPCFGPSFMVAQGEWDGRPVVLGTGDSIGYGRQEVSATADARGNMGWFHKWLDIVGGIGRIPHYFIGNPSAQSARELNTDAYIRWDILDDIKAFNSGKWPFTVVLNQMGTNDSNTVISTWKSRIVGLISRIKTRLGSDMRVVQCTIPPHIKTTTGQPAGFPTAASIDLDAIWTNAGGRGSINTDIRTNTGFGHDGCLDVDVAWVDPANPDKFMSATGLGQLGTMLSVTPGDGSSTHPTGTADFALSGGEVLLIEYQPNLYATRTVLDASDNGDGTYFVTFANTYTTVFQANAKTYWAVSSEGIHPQAGYIDNWIVPRLAQADKSLLI